jgi:hypothetical protein
MARKSVTAAAKGMYRGKEAKEKARSALPFSLEAAWLADAPAVSATMASSSKNSRQDRPRTPNHDFIGIL